MANQTAKKLVKNLWGTWRNLKVTDRSSIASQLGPVGHVLNIAANIQDIAHPPEEVDPDAQKAEDLDDNIIDAEFEEVDP